MKLKNPFWKKPKATPNEVQSLLEDANIAFSALPMWAQEHLQNGGSTEEIIHLSKMPARERKIKLKSVKRFLKKEKKLLRKNKKHYGFPGS